MACIYLLISFSPWESSLSDTTSSFIAEMSSNLFSAIFLSRASFKEFSAAFWPCRPSRRVFNSASMVVALLSAASFSRAAPSSISFNSPMRFNVLFNSLDASFQSGKLNSSRLANVALASANEVSVSFFWEDIFSILAVSASLSSPVAFSKSFSDWAKSLQFSPMAVCC